MTVTDGIMELAYKAAREHDAYWRNEPGAKCWVESDSYAALRVAVAALADVERVGLFSIGRRGDLCFHKGATDASYLIATLNESVTGGPYKARIAYASKEKQA